MVNWRIWWGGGNFFFCRGRNVRQVTMRNSFPAFDLVEKCCYPSPCVWTPVSLSLGSTPHQSETKRKGVLAKGVSAESSVTPKEAEKIHGYWAQQYILALRAPQPREAYILQKKPSKNPLFLVPEFEMCRLAVAIQFLVAVCDCWSKHGSFCGDPIPCLRWKVQVAKGCRIAKNCDLRLWCTEASGDPRTLVMLGGFIFKLSLAKMGQA